jgi:hypothetical protein
MPKHNQPRPASQPCRRSGFWLRSQAELPSLDSPIFLLQFRIWLYPVLLFDISPKTAHYIARFNAVLHAPEDLPACSMVVQKLAWCGFVAASSCLRLETKRCASPFLSEYNWKNLPHYVQKAAKVAPRNSTISAIIPNPALYALSCISVL